MLAVAGLLLSWRRVPATRTLGLLLLVYPVTYGMTHVEARYRLPIEPVMTLVTVLGVLALLERRAAGALARDAPARP